MSNFKGNEILCGEVIAVGFILGAVTLVTKNSLGIITLAVLYIMMGCAEIYWWGKYVGVAEELTRLKKMNVHMNLSEILGFDVVEELTRLKKMNDTGEMSMEGTRQDKF